MSPLWAASTPVPGIGFFDPPYVLVCLAVSEYSLKCVRERPENFLDCELISPIEGYVRCSEYINDEEV